MNDKDPDFRQTGDSQTRILPQTLCQTLFILASLLILLAGPLYAVPSQSPAQAAPIQEQTEAPGQVIYQTRHRLKDSLGNSWQVIFYKRVAESDETRNLNLRLAGFPGAVEFQHPQPLILTPSRGDKLEAADDFAEEAPAPNIGEYDMGANRQSFALSRFPRINPPPQRTASQLTNSSPCHPGMAGHRQKIVIY